METMLLHIGGHGAWSLLSPESLAVIFPTILVAVALAACTSGSGSDDPPPAAVASSQVTPTGRVEIDGIVIDEPDWKASGANWRLRVSWDEPDGIAVDHYGFTAFSGHSQGGGPANSRPGAGNDAHFVLKSHIRCFSFLPVEKKRIISGNRIELCC